jgi:fumarate reductase subunit D
MSVVRRSREPGLWALFSAGGMLTALFLPAMTFALWLAGPFGWFDPPSRESVEAAARHPVGRVAVFAFVFLSVFHWAHRFRYTLYDGLQLYHLNRLIAVLTYGGAVVLTLVAAYVAFVML